MLKLHNKLRLRVLTLCALIPLLGIVHHATAQSESGKFDKDVDALLSKMSVEEKVGQMTQVTIDLILKDNSSTEIDEEKLKKALLEKHVGSILNVKGHAYKMETWHEIITAIQDIATKETAHKIPVVYGIDAIHGANYIEGAVLYPHNIGIAAARNRELVKQSAVQTAIETRASGIRWNFDPVLGLGRQPLWSRFEETYGEDVYLVSELGNAAIEAYQTDDLANADAVAACMKHFLGYSIPRSGKDRTPSYIPEYILREYLLPPFQEAVSNNVETVMINSGEINGVPVHASKYYLTDILRGELGFKGVAVSDWEDVIRLHTRHRVAATPKEAVRMAVEAGLDMSMVPLDYSFYDLLVELVKEGTITEDRLDESVARILKMKFKLGLFENAYPEKEAMKLIDREKEEEIALNAALESMTLIKNEKNTLPLRKDATILLAGPAANNVTALHSSWSYIWQGTDDSRYPSSTKTIKEALSDIVGAKNVICNSKRNYGAPINYDVAQLQKDAEEADYIVLCLGEKAYAESPGSIDDLNLDPKQMQLADAAAETGKPVILVLVEGRPRIISSFEKDMDAVLMAYRPSTKGADAIAQVLVGYYNPNGILPYSYPKHAGDLVTYDHKYTEGIREHVPNEYTSGTYQPLYPFGHGLSYTSFSYSNFSVSQNTFGPADEIIVSVTVKNTGKKAGKKTVELYARDLYASITPNYKRLKGFSKVDLKPGEATRVTFTIAPKDLSLINPAGKRVVEPGDFELMIGDKSQKITFKATGDTIIK